MAVRFRKFQFGTWLFQVRRSNAAVVVNVVLPCRTLKLILLPQQRADFEGAWRGCFKISSPSPHMH